MHATHGPVLVFLWIHLHILFAVKDMVDLQSDMLHHYHAALGQSYAGRYRGSRDPFW